MCHVTPYLLITKVITASQAVADAPSVIISIASPSSTEFAAVGSDESTSPAAEPELATVIPPPVIAVPPISKLIAASPPEIAPCNVPILTFSQIFIV